MFIRIVFAVLVSIVSLPAQADAQGLIDRLMGGRRNTDYAQLQPYGQPSYAPQAPYYRDDRMQPQPQYDRYGNPILQRGYEDNGIDRNMSDMARRMGYRSERAFQSDRQEARRAQQSVLNANRVMWPVQWNNRQTGNNGETMVESQGRDNSGRICRQLRETVFINGNRQETQGLACNVNGRWETVQ